MKKQSTKYLRSDCPINVMLECLGDAWSLLIVRDLMFKGRQSYKEFLDAEEGIASNILADRLQQLGELGIISKHRDSADARRYVYRLTEVGLDLAPALIEMILWSSRYFKTGAPAEIIHQMTCHRDEFLNGVRMQWEKTQQP
jgi:DNA-binding HxlR family transcriptional regulator